MGRRSLTMLVVLALTAMLPMANAAATTDCVFVDDGSTLTLQGDCTTDETIYVPDGYTLDGAGYTITAVDPTGDHFRGAVVANTGTTANVTNLTVAASGLANACDAGADRLRGIMFDGASGSIVRNTVVGINQGPSGCQEGNAIEVRNAPFDGTHANTVFVDVSFNSIFDYQKTGIVANGDVYATITHNMLGASATQENLAANGIQVGYGAYGLVSLNTVAGNQWMGTSNWAASAVLVYYAGGDDHGLLVEKNHIFGNSEVGLFVYGEYGEYSKNHIIDEGPDHPNAIPDWGIVNYGLSNTFEKNHVMGFDYPFYGMDEEGKNKALPFG